MTFEAIQDSKKSLAEQAADQLMGMIVDDNLPVGEKLPNEFQLAQQLGVGRGTVREAVKLLVSRQVVEIRRGKGTFVCQNPGLSSDPLGFAFLQDKVKLVLDLMEIRLLLEPHIAALAAQRATDEEIAAIWEQCLRMEQERESGSDTWLQRDMEFHVLMAQSTRNSVMPNLLPVIHSGIELYNQFPPDEQKTEALAVHREIAAAIEARSPQQAAAAMERHLAYNRTYLEQLEREYRQS